MSLLDSAATRESIFFGVDQVAEWQIRGRVPDSVDVTAGMLGVQLQDDLWFVSGLCDNRNPALGLDWRVVRVMKGGAGGRVVQVKEGGAGDGGWCGRWRVVQVMEGGAGDGGWWRAVEGGGGWWRVVEGGGVWWSVVECGGVWWSVVECGGVWWSRVKKRWWAGRSVVSLGPQSPASAASAASGCHSGVWEVEFDCEGEVEGWRGTEAGGGREGEEEGRGGIGSGRLGRRKGGQKSEEERGQCSSVLPNLELPLEAARRSGAGPGWAFGPDGGSGGPIPNERARQEEQSGGRGGREGKGGAVAEGRSWDREINAGIGWVRGEGDDAESEENCGEVLKGADHSGDGAREAVGGEVEEGEGGRAVGGEWGGRAGEGVVGETEEGEPLPGLAEGWDGA
ncbi:unnamed protein product [Closterium sp. Naga37s-1]|nr:unnamed protein product [Closterium sp. Naga37s-1]